MYLNSSYLYYYIFFSKGPCHHALSPVPAVLEKDMYRWNAKALDKVVLAQKEHLFRVALHVLAYADWFTSALFAASPLSEADLPNTAGLMERLSQAIVSNWTICKVFHTFSLARYQRKTHQRVAEEELSSSLCLRQVFSRHIPNVII